MSVDHLSRSMFALAWILMPTLIGGCGTDFQSSAPSSVAESTESYDFESPGDENGVMAGNTDGGELNSETLAATVAPNTTRKIIYTTTIGLVVEDYKEFETAMPMLVDKHGGFVASSDTDRRYNDNQSGQWIVRVPIDQYSAFLAGVTGLGFAESRSENAQDVTEEYVDLQARISNKKKLEARILTMLEERTGKLSDVLEIERELARVREEVERMEGRLRFLKDRTSLATITITCREEKEYTPPQAPSLLSRISLSWFDSLTSLRRSGEHLLIGIIAAAPWIVVFGIPLLIARSLMKRWWRKRRERKMATA